MAKTRMGLGKGLDLLIPNDIEKESKNENGPVTTLKTSMIEPNRQQPRKNFDPEAIAELASSIKQYGIIQPIIVCRRGDTYEIIAGERRWRAAKKAGLREIPVIIKDYSEKEIAEISLIENIQREDLNPIEEALAYRQLIEEHDLTQEELAERVSKSRSAITNTLRLLRLHPDIQKMLAEGTISAGHARALLSIEDQEKQLECARIIISRSLSVRQTEVLVKQTNTPAKQAKTAVRNDTAYKSLEKNMTEVLGTKVCIRQKEKGRGKIEISYYSEDQLDSLYLMINKKG